MRFIYVVDEKSAEALNAKGYNLLKVDSEHKIWIFENHEETVFGLNFDCRHILLDVLTF